MWLRDVLDYLCHQKLRELSDFEWQQFIRLYLQEDPGNEIVKYLNSTRFLLRTSLTFVYSSY